MGRHRRALGQSVDAAAGGERFSRRVRDLRGSPIREILAVVDRPGMVSFAGGLPAPETFAIPDLSAMPASMLQYGPSEGEPALRARIAEELGRIGLRCGAEQVVVLSGSQQGIDLVAKLFVDPGTPVLVESPTYLAALQVFRFFGARLVELDRDLRFPTGPSPSPVLAYVIPTFQNPTGRCFDAEERDALARRCDAAGIVLFEDDPYRDLAYEPCDRTPVCARLGRTSWVYQGSFSKTYAPGLRLGFLAASPDLALPLVRLKQAADLHTNRVSQWLALRYLDDPGRTERTAAVAAHYRAKRDTFATLLRRHLGGAAAWRPPSGGLFFWLELAQATDTRKLLPAAIEHNVAFMPGEPFFIHAEPPRGALRLNFSHADAEQADRGLAVLASLLR
jgi:2-aminoadipate transaminase